MDETKQDRNMFMASNCRVGGGVWAGGCVSSAVTGLVSRIIAFSMGTRDSKSRTKARTSEGATRTKEETARTLAEVAGVAGKNRCGKTTWYIQELTICSPIIVSFDIWYFGECLSVLVHSLKAKEVFCWDGVNFLATDFIMYVSLCGNSFHVHKRCIL